MEEDIYGDEVVSIAINDRISTDVGFGTSMDGLAILTMKRIF